MANNNLVQNSTRLLVASSGGVLVGFVDSMLGLTYPTDVAVVMACAAGAAQSPGAIFRGLWAQVRLCGRLLQRQPTRPPVHAGILQRPLARKRHGPHLPHLVTKTTKGEERKKKPEKKKKEE